MSQHASDCDSRSKQTPGRIQVRELGIVSTTQKGKVSRPALLRITAVLAIVLVLSVGWEYRQSLNLRSANGKVIEVVEVFSGSSGDNREFAIQYFVSGEKYVLVTRRGLFDAFGAFCCLAIGDSVPIAADREDPSRAILDSLSARFPLTLSFGMLTLIFSLSMLLIAMKARTTK